MYDKDAGLETPTPFTVLGSNATVYRLRDRKLVANSLMSVIREPTILVWSSSQNLVYDTMIGKQHCIESSRFNIMYNIYIYFEAIKPECALMKERPMTRVISLFFY